LGRMAIAHAWRCDPVNSLDDYSWRSSIRPKDAAASRIPTHARGDLS
jgi:hypothetical protein